MNSTVVVVLSALFVGTLLVMLLVHSRRPKRETRITASRKESQLIDSFEVPESEQDLGTEVMREYWRRRQAPQEEQGWFSFTPEPVPEFAPVKTRRVKTVKPKGFHFDPYGRPKRSYA